jgi:hypothetical protein
MELDGREDMALDSVSINGKKLDTSAYERAPAKLTIKACPEGPFELEVVTTIKPQENTLLEGLYKSGGNFCSQARHSSCRLAALRSACSAAVATVYAAAWLCLHGASAAAAPRATQPRRPHQLRIATRCPAEAAYPLAIHKLPYRQRRAAAAD